MPDTPSLELSSPAVSNGSIREDQAISIRGARQNNLKNVSLEIPIGKLNVITGPSGSGKSSLAFDTLYAEGQRRYVETFSPYTRQFFDRMDKPQVDEIVGIPPAIAIEQTNTIKSTRSTVGTITEITDYFKLLMPRVARAFSPESGREIRPETATDVLNRLFESEQGKTLLIAFPLVVPPGREPSEFFEFLNSQGYLRVWVRGKIHRTDTDPELKTLPALVPVIQDRVKIVEEDRSRITESLEAAFRFGKGKLNIIDPDTGEIHRFSRGWHCAYDDVDIRPPTPALFSFNNPLGACPDCNGFGRVIGLDLEKVMPDRRLSIKQGVVRAFTGSTYKESQRDLIKAARRNEIDIEMPFESLPKADQDFVINGEAEGMTGEEAWEGGLWYGIRGFFRWLEQNTYKMHVRVFLSRYRGYHLCETCNGGRFQPETLNYRLCPTPTAGETETQRREGKQLVTYAEDIENYTLPELYRMPADRLLEVLNRVRFPSTDKTARLLHDEITSRLRYIREVGLSYLDLDRPTRSLSGGETARVNLTTCLGASLVNTLFVLDEPSIGMHSRDIHRLIRIMNRLRDNGNTLLVVEHEEAIIRAADNLIDVGPDRGSRGGEILFNGDLTAFQQDGAKSLTADYLSGRKFIEMPEHRLQPCGWLAVQGARENNLKNITAQFPLGVMTCVSGVSGSGKSTLVHQVLHRNLAKKLRLDMRDEPGACDGIRTEGKIAQLVLVDQSQIARTPRSTPALYLNIFDPIRDLFAATQDARAAGFTRSAFSFNSGPGRCQRCQGTGFEKVEMQFLSDIYVRCPECEGKRFTPDLLQITLNDRNVHQVLETTVSDAIEFFSQTAGAAKINPALEILEELGLGYLTLGQPLNTLSGGESQRLKLASHLLEGLSKNGDSNRPGEKILIFDEPTTGLHFDDISLLIKTFRRLVREGHTLIIIEHNLEVMKCADWLIDLGPEGGDQGGQIVATGTPEDIAGIEDSHTGQYLKEVLQREWQRKAAPREAEGQQELTLLVAEEAEVFGSKKRGVEPEPETPQKRNGRGIKVHGARHHNLKNLDLEIPRNELVVVTGLSGSGKSTLAFDILFAEGQRRFLDSMSPYARQFVEQLERPEVDLVEGLPPTVAIEQRISRGGVKSTVGTVTEVYHFLRLLFAKAGTQYCPAHPQTPVQKRSTVSIVREIGQHLKKGSVRVMAPVVKARKGFHTEVANWAERHGYTELFVDRQLKSVKGFQKLDRFREHSIDVVVGVLEGKSGENITNVVEDALKIGKGTIRLLDAKNKLHVASTEMSCPDCGRSFEELDPRLFSFNSPHGWCPECRGMGMIWKRNRRDDEAGSGESELEADMRRERHLAWAEEGEVQVCPQCQGRRLNEVALNVRVQGRPIHEFSNTSVMGCRELVNTLKFTGRDELVSRDILPEITQRLEFMQTVGLGYLQLGRGAPTLSGGESQRIRLASQLGSNLRGVLYVLDEPTIGLHPRDNVNLLKTLNRLRDKGNSLLVVEHDEDTLAQADSVVDLGPGAGSQGGELVVQGGFEEIQKNLVSRTAFCLREPLKHPLRGQRRPTTAKSTEWLELKGATANNLNGIDLKLPVGRLIGISGISGAGKSSLMRGSLLPAVKKALGKSGSQETARKLSRQKKRGSAALAQNNAKKTWKSLKGTDLLETVYEVDQSPIGKTSRSTPATYLKIFDEIRALFAGVPLSRMRGYTASRFSFNTEGGRCETCKGNGMLKLEMNFLPTTWVECPDCHGARYNEATLEVEFDGKTIGDVMQMTIAEAAEFFDAHPKISRTLDLLNRTGLGYLQLGQPSPTLSGGEAQRIKLVAQLARGANRSANARLRQNKTPKSTLYLLEEPTIGLHMDDVRRLIDVLHQLVEEGNTLVVIEHNLDVLAECDYLVDVGPEAGENGGKIVARGKPETVAKSKTSRTAPFLREKLGIEP